MKLDETLRRLDQEIVAHEQQIAMHQVEIMRLTTTRRTLMGIVENDQAAAEARRAEPGLLPGSHAKPMLIVRRVGSGDEPPEAESQAPKKRRGGKRTAGLLNQMKARVLAAVSGEAEGLTTHEIGNHLGIHDPDDRRRMWNAIYQLQVKGDLTRLGNTGKGQRDGRYALPPKANGAAAH